MSVELSHAASRAMDRLVDAAVDDLDVEECAVIDVVARAIESDEDLRRLVRAQADLYNVEEHRDDHDDVWSDVFGAAESLREPIEARVEEVVDDAIDATETATVAEGSA